MSAARHLHPGQLSMFMPAKDLIQVQPNRADYDHYETGKGAQVPGGPSRVTFWTEKLKEASVGRLRGAVAERGVERPVVLHHSPEHAEGVMVANGHHRIVSAASVDMEQLVPVHHYGEPQHRFVHAVQERQR